LERPFNSAFFNSAGNYIAFTQNYPLAITNDKSLKIYPVAAGKGSKNFFYGTIFVVTVYVYHQAKIREKRMQAGDFFRIPS
jgi:hypothetical protein